ncbi:hypothetical protein KSS87_008029 [Heliosperma pusillum]|nr:hypothetical protein KSS87_008029 [Heliosperma pusillum]
MHFEDHSLTLGLGFPSSTVKTSNPTHVPNPNPKQIMIGDEPSLLTLSLSGCETTAKVVPTAEGSAMSSISNVVVSVKRERETSSYDDVDMEEEDGTCHVTTTRKKLRLTKDQSAMLEESFKLHTALSPKQKQALADRLNLRPRQVEVWFQNRRARTKLKQTEVDCEYMKKWVETLRDENRRLQKEVEELKAIKMAKPLYMNLPAATLTMCPSCERIGATTVPSNVTRTPFVVCPNNSHFYATTTPNNNRPLLVDN